MPGRVVLGYNLHCPTVDCVCSTSESLYVGSNTDEYLASLRIFYKGFVVFGYEDENIRNLQLKKRWWLLWILTWSHTISLFCSGNNFCFLKNILDTQGKKSHSQWWWLEATRTEERADCYEVYSCHSKAILKRCLEDKECNTLNISEPLVTLQIL